MSRSQLSKTRKQQQKKKRQQDRDKKNRQVTASKPSRKLSERIDYAQDLIEQGQLDEARELLTQIDQRSTAYYEVVQPLLFIAQQQRDHNQCCALAGRLAELRPRDPSARIMFAQESMHRGRAAVALVNYRIFLERWPDHDHSDNVMSILPVLEKECAQRIEKAGFQPEFGLERQVLHETSLALLEQNRYSECVQKCLKLLEVEPTFASARNNLAIAYYQDGRTDEAVRIVEQTLQLLPENHFARVMLAKFYFLTGNQKQAEKLADEIIADPPEYQDAIVAMYELLAFLGRDDELARLCDDTDEQLVDDHCKAFRQHYAAYAAHRLGRLDEAEQFRRALAKYDTRIPEAEANRDDIDRNVGHAPWAVSLAMWIPTGRMDRIADQTDSFVVQTDTWIAEIAPLVPALLDRGDPAGREMALRLAMADGSPTMLNALKKFGLSKRGPDGMRMEALMFVNERQRIGSGPLRVYSGGRWTDIQLLAAEIYQEALPASDNKEVQRRIAQGVEAMQLDQYDRAEACFDEALAAEPSNVHASYNRCGVWMRRDGRQGIRKARPEIERLHQEHPDYVFARVAMSQFAGGEGKLEEARALLAPIYKRERLHISEAIGLFTAQAELCFDSNDPEGAERAIAMLSQLTWEDHPNVVHLRRRLAQKPANTRGFLKSLFH